MILLLVICTQVIQHDAGLKCLIVKSGLKVNVCYDHILVIKKKNSRKRMVLNDCLLLCFGVNWLCERWWFYVITHVGILRSRWCTLKGGTGCSIKFYSGRLHPEAQILTL